MYLVDQFVENPTGETYLALLDLLVLSPEYAPYNGLFESLERKAENQDWQGVVDEFDDNQLAFLLSPAAHAIVGFAAEKLGERERALMEALFLSACLYCIFECGDGTREKPYPVSIIHDETILKKRLKFESTGQKLERDGDRYFDVFTDESGKQLFFDVTRPFSKLKGQFKDESDDSA